MTVRSGPARGASSPTGLPADDEVGSAVGFDLGEEYGDDLQGLAKAHFIGQNGTKSVVGHEGEPLQADLLVRVWGGSESAELPA